MGPNLSAGTMDQDTELYHFAFNISLNFSFSPFNLFPLIVIALYSVILTFQVATPLIRKLKLIRFFSFEDQTEFQCHRSPAILSE